MEYKSFVFVVNTNSYTGNFERKMCGYMTGMVGDCNVGEMQAKDFKEEIGKDKFHDFEQIIGQEQDDHGCYRPVAIRQTPKDASNYVHETYKYNEKDYDRVCHNDFEIYFNEQPNEELIEIMKQRAYEYAQMKKIEIVGFQLLEKKVVTKYYNIEI